MRCKLIIKTCISLSISRNLKLPVKRRAPAGGEVMSALPRTMLSERGVPLPPVAMKSILSSLNLNTPDYFRSQFRIKPKWWQQGGNAWGAEQVVRWEQDLSFLLFSILPRSYSFNYIAHLSHSYLIFPSRRWSLALELTTLWPQMISSVSSSWNSSNDEGMTSKVA